MFPLLFKYKTPPVATGEVLMLVFQLLDLFPAELRISEMTVTGGLGVDRLAQIQLLQDVPHLKAEVFADDRQQFFIALHTGAESIHAQRDRLALADGIRHLYLTALCKAIGNDVLCDVPAIIRSAAVDLGRILGREATATDPSHSAICIT